MSAFDAFKPTPESTPAPKPTSTESTSVFGKIGDFLGGMFGGGSKEQTQPEPTTTPPVGQPKSAFDAMNQPQTKEVQPTTKPSAFDAFKPDKTGSKSPSYFYAKTDDKGGAIGRSDDLDVSGRPFLGYRNPGDTSTTTDRTRVASTFDPRVAQPLTKDQYYNPRAAGLRDDFQKEFGIKPSEQLDHAIALTVGGSNDKSNLRAIPTEENQAAGDFEGKLAGMLKEGKISYFEAQVADAKNKGIQIPWTPAQQKAGTDKEYENTWDKIKDFFIPEAKAATTDEVKKSAFDAMLVTPKEPTLLDIMKRNESISAPVKGSIPNYLGDLFTNDNNPDRDAVVMAISKNTGADSDLIDRNLTDFTKSLGLRSVPTTREVAQQLATLPVVAGFLSNPVATTLGVVGWTALSAVEKKLLGGKELSDVISEKLNLNQGTSDILSLAEMFAKGKALHGVFTEGPELAKSFATKLTKDMVVTYKLPKSIYIEPETVKEVFRKGTWDESEQQQLYKDLQKTTGRSTAQIKEDIKNGVRIDIPAEKVVEFVDKPYWSKLKELFSNPIEAFKSTPNKQGGFVKNPLTPEEEPSPKTETTANDIVGEGKDLPTIEKNTQKYVDENTPALLKEYQEKHGNVFNVDNMKDLIPGHLENSTLSEGFHKPVAKLVGKMVDKAIKENAGENKTINFMGGAPAVGKSMAANKFTGANLTVDGTLADTNRSIDQMELALKKGYKVHINYVDDDPKQIIDNAIARAQRNDNTGRTVPVETIINALQKSRQNVLRANGRFGQGEYGNRFVVRILDRRGGTNKLIPNGIDFLRSNVYSDADIADIKKTAYLKINQLYEQGKLTKKQEEGFTRRRQESSSATGQGSGRNGSFIGEEWGEERKGGQVPSIEPRMKVFEREAANRELTKELKKEEATKPTEADKKLTELLTHREVLKESISQSKVREFSRYAGPNGLGEVTGEKGGIWKSMGDEKANELGFPSSEAARTAYDEYKASIAQLNALNENVQSVRREIAGTRAEQKETRSLNHLLNRKATPAEIEIAKRDRVNEIKKAEFERQEIIRKEEAERTTLQQKINRAKFESSKKLGFIGKIFKALNPSRYLDPVSKPIIEKWFQKTLSAKQAGLEEFTKALKKGEQNFNEIVQFQAGKQTPYIREAFDSMGSDFKNRGLSFAWVDNYMPDVWKDNPARQAEARKSALRAKGMTDKEIAEYLGGMPLEEGKALRLKLRPNFSKERFWPDYATGMAHGLRPKFTIPAQLIGYYKEAGERAIANLELIDQLQNEARLLPAEDAPDTWKPVTLRFSRKGLYAPKNLADLLNGKFRDENDLKIWETAAKGISTVSKVMQDIVLSGGVPFTNINFFTATQAYKLVATVIGDVASLKFKQAFTRLNTSLAFIRSNSNKVSADWFRSKQGYLTMMAKNGIDVTDNVGGQRYKTLAKAFSDSISIGEGPLRTAMEVGKLAYHKAITEKTFQSLMPQIKVSLFEGAYRTALNNGASAAEAEKTAAEFTKKSEGIIPETGRGDATKDTLSSLFFAPPYREGLMRIFYDSYEGFKPNNYKNSDYDTARHLIYGLAVIYAIYNLVNKKVNGHYMWDNPPGRDLSLRIPMNDGTIAYFDVGPGLLTVPRNLFLTASSLLKGDIDTAKQKLGTAFSMPLQRLSELLANKDYFGNPIYSKNDDGKTIVKKIAAYLALETTHPYVSQIYKYIAGKQPLSWSLANMAELPVKLTDLTKEQSSAYYDKLNAEAKARSQAREKLMPFYNKLQTMKDDGQQKEADDLYNTQSKEDKVVYDSIKKSEKAKDTKARNAQIQILYDNLQKMKDQGRNEEANTVYFGLSEDDRISYDRIRDSKQK